MSQPDILFVKLGRLERLGKDCLEGAPDLIVEILSPSNWVFDRQEKIQAYESAGVPEYWIIDCRARTVEVFLLEEARYRLAGKLRTGERVHATQLEGFSVAEEEIFAG